MPVRMWTHGIQPFLELLRRRLPDSYEQMLTFFHVAYGIIALLYDTMTAFRGFWAECLCSLARYRMEVEETEVQETEVRETWTNIARFWCGQAADASRNTGTWPEFR